MPACLTCFVQQAVTVYIGDDFARHLLNIDGLHQMAGLTLYDGLAYSANVRRYRWDPAGHRLEERSRDSLGSRDRRHREDVERRQELIDASAWIPDDELTAIAQRL